jgi:hypothetical protein
VTSCPFILNPKEFVMQTVILKNGSEVPVPTVATVSVALENFMQDKVLAFYDFVMHVRGKKDKLSASVIEAATSYGLIDGTDIHDDVRAVILSAVTGEGLQMSLSDPVVR